MTLVHKVNDAADAMADATDFTWAIFYMVQGLAQDEATNALTA